MTRSILSLLVTLLFLGPVQAQELTLSVEKVLPSFGQEDAYNPVIAIGSSTALVIWQSGFNENSSIVGIRIDKEGNKIDSLPFVICNAADVQEVPKVAYNNGTYLVVWHDLRNGMDYDTYCARVTEAGEVLDANGVVVADGARGQRDPSVCAHGQGFLIAWRFPHRDATTFTRDSYRLASRMRLADGSFSVIDTIPFVTEIIAGAPILTSIGDNKALLLFSCFVSWGIPQKTISWRQMEDGKPTVVGTFGNASSIREGHEMAVATDGVNAMMVWGNWMITGGRGAPCKGGMALLPLATINTAPAISVPYPAEGGNRPSVVWDGFDYIMSWQFFTTASVATTNDRAYDNVKTKSFSAEGAVRVADMVAAGSLNKPVSNGVLATEGKGTSLLVYESHPASATEPIKVALKTIFNSRSAGVEANSSKNNFTVKSFHCTPNPFSSTAHITLTGEFGASSNNYKAEVFNLQGRKITSLVPNKVSLSPDNTGMLSYVWSGTTGERPEGVYVFKIRSGKQSWNGKLIYVK